MEVDEVADVAEDQPVVAVAQGPGHDQAQRDGQRQAGGGAAGRTASRQMATPATIESPAKIRLLYGTTAPKPQRAPVLWLVCSSRTSGDRAGRRASRAGRSGEDQRLGRQVERGPAQRDRPEEDPAGPDRDPRSSSAVLQLPCTLECSAACTAGPGAAAWRSARRIPRTARTCPCSIRSSASLISSSVSCSFSIRPSVNSWS